jgi:3-phytase
MWRIFKFVCVISLAGCGGDEEFAAFVDNVTDKNHAIVASVETAPTLTQGVVNPAIWIHPTDRSESAVIGAGNGLEVYDLKGNIVHIEPAGQINAVDLRYQFPFRGEVGTLIAASNEFDNTLNVYTIEPETLQLRPVASFPVSQDIKTESLCLYHSAISGQYYAMMLDSQGKVEQWQLFQTSEGDIDARRIRQFNVGSKINGCVADDEYAHLYVALDTGILKYGAEPEDETTQIRLDHGNSQIACLTLYYAKGQKGYLIAFNEGNNTFEVYQRGNDNEFLGRFRISNGNRIDSVENAQGIAVTNAALNHTFEKGLFVTQDTNNTEPDENRNFKLVSWEGIAESLLLVADTTLNPRQIGQTETSSTIKSVQATVETEAVQMWGDAADDIAIWIHPLNTSLSTIIGTQKRGGINVYDLSGKQLQYLPDGKINNVDLRYHFQLDNEKITLVAASNRTDDSIALYQINPLTRQLENVAARRIQVGLENEVYGLCMYHNPLTDQYSVIVNNKSGAVEQWALFDNGKGQVDARLVRQFEVGSQTEGCVADDEHGQLYIGEENVGIWQYQADPEGGTTRRSVDTTGKDGHLTADVEGLTIYNSGDGKGYLIASSQGNNSFTIYNRTGNNEYIGTFKIVANDALKIDKVSDSDGIDVTNIALGEGFPYGVFIAQDGWNNNPIAPQNFKLVPWEKIADSFGLDKQVGENPWF